MTCILSHARSLTVVFLDQSIIFCGTQFSTMRHPHAQPAHSWIMIKITYTVYHWEENVPFHMASIAYSYQENHEGRLFTWYTSYKHVHIGPQVSIQVTIKHNPKQQWEVRRDVAHVQTKVENMSRTPHLNYSTSKLSALHDWTLTARRNHNSLNRGIKRPEN